MPQFIIRVTAAFDQNYEIDAENLEAAKRAAIREADVGDLYDICARDVTLVTEADLEKEPF